jgi:5'-methylthioadenosine phosphorylase
VTDELIGLIGGSGLGDALATRIKNVRFIRVSTPFGRTSDRIMVGKIGKNRVAFINRHGPGHKLLPGEVPYAANVFALKSIGVRTVIATGAVGSLRQAIKPGELVLVDQFIDKTCKRQSSFFGKYGAVHCEMAEPVCRRLSETIAAMAAKLDFKTHKKGTYVCMEGPQFSTRAESLMHRKWGGDLVGMTGMPEAKLAREAQMCYALIALVSDYDCWRPRRKQIDKQSLLQEIITNMERASKNCLSVIEQVLANREILSCEDCVCRRSLGLAVWTNQDAISAAQKRKLAVLFE